MPIAASARARWKKKFPFGLQQQQHHHHNHNHNHHRSSSNSNFAPSSPSESQTPTPTPTPMSFICPISSSLMFDPVIIPTGHTFERACIEACGELNFTPPSLSSLDFSSTASSSLLLIPNAALRAAIIDWCDHLALPHPPPISQHFARALVQNLITTTTNSNSQVQLEEDEEDYYSHNNNKNKQQQQQKQPPPPPSSTSSSSSSSCCSYPSSSSTSSFSSSDILHLTTASTSSSSLLLDVDTKTPKSTAPAPATAAAPKTPNSTATADPAPTTSSTAVLEEDSQAQAQAQSQSILVKLKNPQISVKESGLVTLRHSARESSQRRISLCTPTLLSALLPMILSTNSSIQINATAALVNLSIHPANKVKIVRSGAVPPLVQALDSTNNHSEEARYNAAGALFSLALEDENKLAIGVLGAIPPLLNLFCRGRGQGQGQQQQQQSEFAGAGHGVARVEAGMALYHLSLAPNNLSKIAETAWAVKSILNVATSNADDGAVKGEIEQEEETIRLRLRRVAMMLLGSLARRNEGRVALMDADAVKAMVGMMKAWAAGSEEDYCLAVMYEMSKASLRFRALARAAGAERVLLAMAGDDNEQGRGEIGKERARRTLKVIRGDEEKGV